MFLGTLLGQNGVSMKACNSQKARVCFDCRFRLGSHTGFPENLEIMPFSVCVCGADNPFALFINYYLRF
jgi:hypothetical protein